MEVYFEKENNFTLDSKGELLITIMSSLAQEESRSISENVTWGRRKRFSDGKVSLAYTHFLGYDKGADGSLVVNPKEAEIVRQIYRLYLEGRTPLSISSCLTENSIPTPSGKREWSQTTVISILTNEKYKGDALLQKNYTVDFLQKKLKKNSGEVQQYYVEGAHEAIIQPDEWERVQAEMARRRKMGHRYRCGKALSSKLICADCGSFYGSKVWHSNDKYRSVIWRCNNKYHGEVVCKTPHLKQEAVQEKFLTAYGLLLKDRDTVIADCKLLRSVLADSSALDADIAKLDEEIEIVAELIRKCVSENAAAAQSQEEYQKRYAGLVKRSERMTGKRAALIEEKDKRAERDRELQHFIDSIKDTWDERVWTLLIENATVQRDGRITFRFVNGSEITI